MKRQTSIALAAGALAALLASGPARAAALPAYMGPATTVSVSMFYGDLSPWGHWVDVAPYGWCWAPDDVYADWGPYRDGYWVYSDVGWTWVTDEPWGWATYHYGRWFYDPRAGWVWLPGTEWGPAWVAWRDDPEWIGWAPLPPGANVYAVFNFGYDSRIATRAWSFTRVHDFGSRGQRDRLVPVDRNAELFRHTRDATRYGRKDGRPFLRGVDVASIERRSGRPMPRIRTYDVGGSRDAGRFGRGGDLGVFRPQVKPARRDEAPRDIERGRPVERAAGYDRPPGRAAEPNRDADPKRDDEKRKGQPERGKDHGKHGHGGGGGT